MATMLAVLDRAGTGSVETQFADVFYAARELHRQFGGVDLLLRGTAATAALQAPPLGPLPLTRSTSVAVPDDRESLRGLLADYMTVYVDLTVLGLHADRLIDGVEAVDSAVITRRWPQYERVWFL